MAAQDIEEAYSMIRTHEPLTSVEIERMRHDIEWCPRRDDFTHCVHWWDGDTCCDCHTGDPTMEDKPHTCTES